MAPDTGVPSPAGDTDPALRPLDRTDEARASLRAAAPEPRDAGALLVEVIDGIEASLRHLLHDLPSGSTPVRLRALAPGELGPDEILAELRQHDRISVPVAAQIHDLFRLRRRLREGEPPGSAEVQLALDTADALEREIRKPPVPAPVASGPLVPARAEAAALPSRPRRRLRPLLFAVALAAGLLAATVLLWATQRPDDAQLDQGIALFRTGAYADAASRFYRYAQAHPDDPTPHLYLVRIHRRMGRPDLAAQELRVAFELAPEDGAVHREMGFFLLDAGRADAAVERFRTAVQLDPEPPSGWIGLVRALRDSGRDEAAERVLRQAPAEVRAMLADPAIDAAGPGR